MSIFVKQCKGKALKDLSKKARAEQENKMFLVGTKYDGQYVQIHKVNHHTVRFFTSGGKEIYFHDVALELMAMLPTQFKLEGEYIGKTSGFKGDRTDASLGSFISDFKHGRKSYLGDSKIMIFDTLHTKSPFIERYKFYTDLLRESKYCRPIFTEMYNGLDKACASLSSLLEEDAKIEGIMVKAKDHMYIPGKRVSDSIKVKERETADLFCYGYLEGKGKYKGLIGSLLLSDSKGRKVQVGSGLSDADRHRHPEDFTGKIVEIGYEQIILTYIQPTFIAIRNDKTESD